MCTAVWGGCPGLQKLEMAPEASRAWQAGESAQASEARSNWHLGRPCAHRELVATAWLCTPRAGGDHMARVRKDRPLG